MMTAHDHHEHSKPFWESMATDTEDAWRIQGYASVMDQGFFYRPLQPEPATCYLIQSLECKQILCNKDIDNSSEIIICLGPLRILVDIFCKGVDHGTSSTQAELHGIFLAQ